MKRILHTTLLIGAVLASTPMWTSNLASGASASPSAAGKTLTPAKTPRASKFINTTKPNQSLGVSAMFAKGMQIFDAGKFKEALLTFDQILKRYPAYEPNKKMLARTLYKLDRLPESWTFFSKIQPATLDPDTSYEYGFVAFNARQYEVAMMTLQRVPDGHALQDLAGYYGGLSALKLRRYEQSETMFQQAQVLPDRLARSRGLYLRHVQQLILLQEQAGLRKERDAEKTRITAVPPTPAPSPAPANPAVAATSSAPTAPPTSTAPAPYEHKGFMGVKRITTFKGEKRTQLSDNHGFTDSTTSVSIGTFKFLHGPLQPFGAAESIKGGSSSGRRNAIGMQIQFGGEDRDVNGKERRMVIVEDEQDIVRIQQTDLINTHRQFAYIGADPWLEFSLGNDLWLQTGITSYFEYPDFKRLGRTGNVKGVAGIGAKRGATTWRLSAGSGVFLDTNNKTTTETKDGTLTVSYDLNANANIEVEAGIKDFLYKTESLDGPDQSLNLGATLSYSFGAGISTSVFAAYEKQKNAFFYGMPTYDELSADGDVLTAELALSAKPAPWITFGLVQVISKTTWQIEREDAKETFQKNVPDFLSLLKGNVAINLPF